MLIIKTVLEIPFFLIGVTAATGSKNSSPPIEKGEKAFGAIFVALAINAGGVGAGCVVPGVETRAGIGVGIGAGVGTGDGAGVGIEAGTGVGAGAWTGTGIEAGVGTGIEAGVGMEAGTGVGAGTWTGAWTGTGIEAGATTGLVAEVVIKEVGALDISCVILGKEVVVCGRVSAPPDALRASA